MNLTPWMKQFYELKEQNPDTILFFRMWDFYEMFDEDAKIAHKILWINITSRNKNAQNPIPLAWIPYHARDKYLPILVKAGYKVSIAEQVSDPKLKWIVKREIVRTVTPATINLEWDNFIELNNYIIAITEEKWFYWMSFLESNSFEWKTSEFDSFDNLVTQIYKIAPKEVILDKNLFSNTHIKEILEKKYSLNIYYYDTNFDEKMLLKHFWVSSFSAFWLEGKNQAIKASNLLLKYLQDNQKSDLKHLNKIWVENFSKYLEIDESTLNNLDIIYNFQTKSATVWTLFWVLNKTHTPMGKRFLRDSLIKPLKSKIEIEKRQLIVKELLDNTILREKIIEKLKGICDLENILTRLALNRANPRDLLNLKNSLQNILDLIEVIKSEGSSELKGMFGV